MMGTELGVIARGGTEATAWVTARLEEAALHVYRSFDLRSARAVSSSCACPDHGTDACDCQMVVLLVYQGQDAPATVILHGHQGRTWILLADTPDTKLEATIESALALNPSLPAEVQ
jgi:hypothetical protein